MKAITVTPGIPDSAELRDVPEPHLDEISDGDPFTGTQIDRRLAHGGGVRADLHDVVEIGVLERDEHRHQLRDARNRETRPARVLRQNVSRGGVLDHERARRDRRSARMSRSGENEGGGRNGARARRHGRRA